MDFSFLIVDDETLSRNYICDMILEFEPDAVIAQAASGKDALTILETFKPDVLFLDVKMHGMNGFELLDRVPARDFELVFVTAYSGFALRAFKESACDYVLKPVKKSEFRQTLSKTITRRTKELEQRNQSAGSRPCGKVVIHNQQGIKVIAGNSIVYLEADNTYTTLYTAEGEKIVTSKPIGHFEKTLDASFFFRIHKSYIINLFYFKEYISKGDMAVLMKNEIRLPVSRYRLNDFLKKVAGKQIL